MNRRAFLHATSASAALASAGGLRAAPAPPSTLVGIQIAGHSLLDEGIERCLDTVQSTCRANTLFLYSHSWYAAHNRPPSVYADHGVPIRDERKRKITRVWLRHDDARFARTALRVPRPGADEEYGERDLFAELAGHCQRRGLKLYARILEPGAGELRGRVTHAERALSVGLDGKPGDQPCRNNPEWQGFWDALVEDTVRAYPIDGYQWGAERFGPLSGVLWRAAMPACFCPHCEARAKREGINFARAKTGYTELHAFIAGLHRGAARPADGVFTQVLRLLYRFPEILAWDYQWRLALEEQGRRTHALVKAARPTVQVGRHFDHQNTSWDSLFLAQWSYADVVPYTDFIKPILYQDILGPHLRWWHLERLKKGPLAELSLQQSLDLYYALRGYDPALEPKLEQLDERGLSADYVGRETRRIADVVQGGCGIVPGIGVDIPYNIQRPGGPREFSFRSTPEALRATVREVFRQGATGLLVSREYDEMRLENLRAIGDTLREMGRA
jgi:hypothetical protein